MPYREKTAWLSLIAMALTFGPYFAYTMATAGSHRGEPLPNLRQLGLYAATTIVQLIILGIGHLYLRLATPRGDRTPTDERDRAITSRSMSVGYFFLIAGMIQVGCFMPFYSGGWSIVNTAIFAIVVAEVIRYCIVVVSYRRQA